MITKDTIKMANNTNIEKYYNILKKSKANEKVTWQGIKVTDICNCITIENEPFGYEHVVFTLNLNVLKTISSKKITSLTIPDFVEHIRGCKDTEFGYNFCMKNRISNIKLPKSLKFIESETFALYKYLETVEFELYNNTNELLVIGNDAFYGCEKLKEINLSLAKEYDSLDFRAFNKAKIDTLIIGNNIKELENLELLKSGTVDIKNINIVGDCDYTLNQFMNRLELENGKVFWGETSNDF